MVTLVDIAERAGVSVYSVSCALRGAGRVSAATRERVRVLAAEMGYVPNAAGRLLVAGRRRGKGVAASPAIAVVRFGQRGGTLAKRYDERMVRLAGEQGYALQVVYLEDFPSLARMCQVLCAQGVGGLILMTSSAPSGFGMKELAGMDWDRFSIVRISRGIDDLHCHTVRASAFSETKYALNWIVAAGYRRIGAMMVMHSASEEDDYGRLGALRAFEDLRRDTYDWMGILRFDQSPSDVLPVAARKWLTDHRPDVVLGFPVTWRALLVSAGYRIPEDLAFVGLPVFTAEEALTGVAATGSLSDFFTREFPAALDMLHEELAVDRRGLPARPYQHVLPVVWQDGVTTRPRRMF